MAKTNAQRQKEYRERKKAEPGEKFLEKERKRQKKYYIKTKTLSAKELKDRRENVKHRVRKHRQHRQLSLTTQSSSATDVSSLVVAMDFTKKGDSSRKRKRSRQNRTQWKIAKLQKENDSLTKRNCTLIVRVHRMKNQNKTSKGVETPRKSVDNLLRKNGLTPRKV